MSGVGNAAKPFFELAFGRDARGGEPGDGGGILRTERKREEGKAPNGDKGCGAEAAKKLAVGLGEGPMQGVTGRRGLGPLFTTS